MALAMTVGATKIQILQEKALSSLAERDSRGSQPEPAEKVTAEQEVCST